MPPEGVAWQAHQNIIRYEEILEIVKVAAEQGVREVRLTGGEPLIRPNLTDLVSWIAAIPGIEDISLTTNGLLLEKLAEPLAQAGLKRVNISLDTLNEEKFARITRGGSFEKVWKGLLAASAAGLAPIKINAVAMKGVNDDEILDLARLSLNYDWHVRFIELMPIKNQAPWGEGFPPPADCYLSIKEILKLLEPLGIEPTTIGVTGNGPAQEYRVQGAPGRIGIISALGEQFCDGCNRLRLTADGYLRPCLMNDGEVYLLDALRKGEPILPLIQEAVMNKPRGHELNLDRPPEGRCMTQIGG
jgi:cyclic pyranopterin phosphate synthase